MKLTNRRNEPGRVNATLWWREPYDGPSLTVDLGRAGSRSLACELEVGGDERDLTLRLALWWVSLYVVLAGLIPWSWRRASYARAQRQAERLGGYAHELDPLQGRTTGIRAFDGSVWIELWKNPDCWRSEDTPSIRRVRGRWQATRGHLPWNGLGWSWTLHVVDWLLGRQRHQVDAGWTRTVPTAVRMPEGAYAAVATTERVRWGRRWWWGRWQYRTTVEVPGGLPIPGKGENSWDCDDDATYAISFAAEAAPPAWEREHADRMALDVLRTRQRRAGLCWVPSGGWPAHRATA